MATAYARRMFSGGSVSTTIPTGMASTDTSFTVSASTNWSDGSAGNFMVVVDFGQSTQEKILCSSRAGLVVTVAAGGRGYDGTSAVQHSANCSVQQCHGAQDDDEANQVVSAVLGQSGAAKGDILYMLSAAGPNTLKNLAVGSNGGVLSAASGVPAWSGASTSPAVLQSAGSSVPTWQTPSNGYGISGFAAAPMVPAVSLTTASSYISGSNVTISQSVTNITSVSLAAGTWLVIAQATLENTAASISACQIFLGPNSASATSLYSSANIYIGNVVGATQVVTLPVSALVTLGSSGTVYLEGLAPTTNVTALYQTTPNSYADCTGIVAVRIA